MPISRTRQTGQQIQQGKLNQQPGAAQQTLGGLTGGDNPLLRILMQLLQGNTPGLQSLGTNPRGVGPGSPGNILENFGAQPVPLGGRGIPSFQHGGIKQGDGLAFLHDGEAIVPQGGSLGLSGTLPGLQADAGVGNLGFNPRGSPLPQAPDLTGLINPQPQLQPQQGGGGIGGALRKLLGGGQQQGSLANLFANDSRFRGGVGTLATGLIGGGGPAGARNIEAFNQAFEASNQRDVAEAKGEREDRRDAREDELLELEERRVGLAEGKDEREAKTSKADLKAAEATLKRENFNLKRAIRQGKLDDAAVAMDGIVADISDEELKGLTIEGLQSSGRLRPSDVSNEELSGILAAVKRKRIGETREDELKGLQIENEKLQQTATGLQIDIRTQELEDGSQELTMDLSGTLVGQMGLFKGNTITVKGNQIGLLKSVLSLEQSALSAQRADTFSMEDAFDAVGPIVRQMIANDSFSGVTRSPEEIASLTTQLATALFQASKIQEGGEGDTDGGGTPSRQQELEEDIRDLRGMRPREQDAEISRAKADGRLTDREELFVRSQLSGSPPAVDSGDTIIRKLNPPQSPAALPIGSDLPKGTFSDEDRKRIGLQRILEERMRQEAGGLLGPVNPL